MNGAPPPPPPTRDTKMLLHHWLRPTTYPGVVLQKSLPVVSRYFGTLKVLYWYRGLYGVDPGTVVCTVSIPVPWSVRCRSRYRGLYGVDTGTVVCTVSIPVPWSVRCRSRYRGLYGVDPGTVVCTVSIPVPWSVRCRSRYRGLYGVDPGTVVCTVSIPFDRALSSFLPAEDGGRLHGSGPDEKRDDRNAQRP